MAYAKINNVTNANMAKVNNVAKAAIGKISGIDAPSTGATFADNKSLDFDGSDDYINIDDFEFTNENISVSWWCTRESTAHNKMILQALNNHDSDAYYKGFAMMAQQDVGLKWYFGEQAGGAYWGTNSGDIGFNSGDGWHHFVFTIGEGPTTAYISPPMALYMDGNSVWTQAGNPSGTSVVGSAVAIKLRIGVRQGGSNAWLGNINDVAFFDTVLTSAEVVAMYNSGDPTDLRVDGGDYASSSNLTGYWWMGDEDTYPTIQDRSTNSNDGTMTNMTSGDIETDVPAP